MALKVRLVSGHSFGDLPRQAFQTFVRRDELQFR